MNNKTRIDSISGAILAIAFALPLVTGCRPAGEDDAKAKNAVKAVEGRDNHDKAKGTVFGNIQGNFEPKDLNAPKRSVLASVPRPAGEFLGYSPDGTTIATLPPLCFTSTTSPGDSSKCVPATALPERGCARSRDCSRSWMQACGLRQ